MRYLLHPFQLVIIAICCVIGAASITLIMTSSTDSDPNRHAAGWVGAMIVAALVTVLIADVTRHLICDLVRAHLRGIRDEIHELVTLEVRRIRAERRQLPAVQDDTGPQSIRNLN